MPELNLAEEGLELLFGTRDEHLRRIEAAFGVELAARGSQVSIEGAPAAVHAVSRLLDQLSRLIEKGFQLRSEDVSTAIRVIREAPETSLVEFFSGEAAVSGGPSAEARRMISPRSLNQKAYVKAMTDHDMVISVGPAGTGKTYLAVAMAATALIEDGSNGSSWRGRRSRRARSSASCPATWRRR